MEVATFERLPQMVVDLRNEFRELRKALQDRKPEPPTDNPNDLLTPSEVCDLLRCSRATLWRWENAGKVKSVTIGGKRLYRRGDLLEALTPKR